MKKLILVSLIGAGIAFFAACSGGEKSGSASNQDNQEATTDSTEGDQAQTEATEGQNPSYDPNRGEGKFKDYEPGAINPAWVKEGQTVYESKCVGCHKLTSERLVGPGWAGVTKRHTGAWILNFVTNPDAMLDQDPELKQQQEICMVRMPNQNLSDDQAKEVYDFMRQNDKGK